VVRLAATGTDVPAQTPHSGYHWDQINRDRFFEGWYFRVAIPEGPSFAWMYSIEVSRAHSCLLGSCIRQSLRGSARPTRRLVALAGSDWAGDVQGLGWWALRVQDPAGGGTFSGVGAQVMGPEDGYLIQHSPSVRTFWASSTALELGDTFQLGTPLPPPCVVGSQGSLSTRKAKQSWWHEAR